jgi:hypothetical protein
MSDTKVSSKEIEQMPEQQEVTFNYLKSQFFRVIHADGAWGGVSPRGDIHISFYNERMAIPDKSRVVISESGNALKPEEFESTSAVVREVEADVVVDLTTAIQLRDWLNNKISTLEAMIRAVRESERETRNSNDEKMAQLG